MTDASAQWYVVNRYGDAEACESLSAADASMRIANRYEKHNGPHRAVQMVEVDELTRLRGEASVMRELLRRCLAVISIAEPLTTDEADALADLNQKIERAIGDAKGTLL